MKISEKLSIRMLIAWLVTGATVIVIGIIGCVFNPSNLNGFYFMLGIGGLVCPSAGAILALIIEIGGGYENKKNNFDGVSNEY